MDNKNNSIVKYIKESSEKRVKDINEYLRRVEEDIRRRPFYDKVSIVLNRLGKISTENVAFYRDSLSQLASKVDYLAEKLSELESSSSECEPIEAPEGQEKTRVSEEDTQSNLFAHYNFCRKDAVEYFSMLTQKDTGVAMTYGLRSVSGDVRDEQSGICIVFTHVDRVDGKLSDDVSDAIGEIIMRNSKYEVDLNRGKLNQNWEKKRVSLSMYDGTVLSTVMAACSETAMEVFERRKSVAYRHFGKGNVSIYFSEGFWQEFFVNLGMDLNIDG